MKSFCLSVVSLLCLFFSFSIRAEFSEHYFAPVFYSVDVNSRLQDKDILKLAEDEKGFLWLGTASGLFRYDGYEYKKIHFPDDDFDFANIYVRALLAGNNALWIGTLRSGLFRLDLTTYQVKQYHHDNGLQSSISGNQVNDLALDRYGNLWVATNYGLDQLKHEQQTFLHYHSSEGPADRFLNFLLDVEFDRENNLWLATGRGLAKFDDKTGSFQRVFTNAPVAGDQVEKKQQHLQGVRVRRIHAADDGRIWLATHKQGVYVIAAKEGKVIRLPATDSKKGRIHTAIAQPSSKEIWFSSIDGVEIRDADTGDILKVVQANRQDAYGLNNKSVYGMALSKSGLLWLGVSGLGLQYYNPGNNAIKRFDTYAKALQPVFDGVIDNAIKLSENKVLLLSGGKPMQFDLQTGDISAFRLAPEFDKENIKSALQLNDDNLLLGTERGELIYYNVRSGLGHRYPLPLESREGGAVWDIVEGKPGQAWVAANNRVFRLDLNTMTFEPMMDAQGKPFVNNIYYLMFDSQNRLWISATNNGVGVVEEGNNHVDIYNKQVGTAGTLSDNFVTQIVENHRGEILLKTRSGLDKLVAKTDGEMRFLPFAVGLGERSKREEKLLPLPDETYWFGSYVKLDRQGNILGEYNGFDGVLEQGDSVAMFLLKHNKILNISASGILLIDLTSLHSRDFRPAIAVSELTVGNRPSSLSFNDKLIHVPADENKFSLRFSALDLSSPLDNRYRYKLEGYEEHWNETSSDVRQAAYMSLPPGTYRLLLDGTNRTGQWSGSPLKIKVVVDPTIYQTLWFQIMAVVLFSGFIYLVFRWRIRVVRQAEREAYEKKEAIQRAHMLDALMEKKNQLFADVSHELRTPLTALQLRIEALQHKLEEDVEASYDGLMKKVTDINHLIYDIYQLSKSDAGALSFELKPYCCDPLINEVADDLAGFVRLHGFTWRQTISLPSSLQVNVDKEKFNQVLHNLVSNSVAYTDKPGTIALRVTVADSAVHIVVEDSSPGVTEENMLQIFERFYRVESSRSRATGGSGLGLSICKSIVEAFKGDISPSASSLGGLAITIKLPVNGVGVDIPAVDILQK
ncbi:hypothetical protein SG34_032720 [Thalassomonas viridans]|uniref:histidine kinase n=1 Tax=Thalassomonas viridans TaxID=137584 RepID=A0AAE9Z8J4_9GAMM|nr:two-component regulator propeller domain-containing protein [Thalassomonas viridans]WDE08676.1 hypothetical protein SG34_032720 [Thalassomonas viridans]